MLDLKTLLDDPVGPSLLRPLARIAPLITGLLISFMVLSTIFNLLYYLGDVSRDSLTTRTALIEPLSPQTPTGLVASTPAIMNNRSKGYQLILANDPLTQGADVLVVTITGVRSASLLPAETSIFTFTSGVYRAVGLELRNEPTPLLKGLGQLWPTDASDAVVNLQVERILSQPQPIALELRVAREPPLWGLLRQIFVIDSFNTAALGIGLVLVILQRLTSARKSLVSRKADEVLAILRDQYRSGQHEFKEMREQIAAYERRYSSLLRRNKTRKEALKALADEDQEVHKRIVTRAEVARGPAEALPADNGVAASLDASYLDEHVAWFLYYSPWNDTKREILETLEQMRETIRDPALRQAVIRQVRLARSKGSAQSEANGGSDPEFPQLPASLLERFAKEHLGDGTLIVCGAEGSGKSCLLDFIGGQLERQLETADGYTLVVRTKADKVATESTVMRLVAAEMLRQLRELLNRHPDLMSDLLDERDQDRLLGFTRELDQNLNQPSPGDRQLLALIGRVYEQLAYQRMIVLVDNAPPTLDVNNLIFVLRIGLPSQLAQGTRVCCAYSVEPVHVASLHSQPIVTLEWIDPSILSDDPGSPLGRVLNSAFFSHKPRGRRPGQRPGQALERYTMVELLSNLLSTERPQAALKTILSNSRTPADLVVWRHVFEQYFVEWGTPCNLANWDRLYSAMEAERRQRETGPRWSLRDWEQAKRTLQQSTSGDGRPEGREHDD
jgi:Cdc6-like AAA superfamily ATPase